jgi:hypothetical protein
MLDQYSIEENVQEMLESHLSKYGVTVHCSPFHSINPQAYTLQVVNTSWHYQFRVSDFKVCKCHVQKYCYTP